MEFHFTLRQRRRDDDDDGGEGSNEEVRLMFNGPNAPALASEQARLGLFRFPEPNFKTPTGCFADKEEAPLFDGFRMFL